MRLARSTRDESVIIVHEVFRNPIHTHRSHLYSCAETHEVALGLKVCKGERERGGGGGGKREGPVPPGAIMAYAAYIRN